MNILVTLQEQRTISFLLSYVGKVFNAAFSETTKSPDLDGGSSLNDVPTSYCNALFIEHHDYWVANFEYVIVLAFGFYLP